MPLAAARDDFADPLLSPLPAPAMRRGNPGLLVALLLVCLLPRALMAGKVDVLVPDGAYYIGVAREVSQGNFEQAFAKLHLNLYPLVLSALHAAGIEWQLAGEWWSVFLATLVVLPLYGFVRRRFDDRVALLACLLYAVHPGLIEWSVEIIRDPTFWFLWTLTLYLIWRAVTEVRLGFFLAAGAALTLAIHVRFEGWALLIPLSLWTGWRWLSLAQGGRRLAIGAALCVCFIPVSLVTVNLTWLRDNPHWELGRFSPLEIFVGDWQSPDEDRSAHEQKHWAARALPREVLETQGSDSGEPATPSPLRSPVTTAPSRSPLPQTGEAGTSASTLRMYANGLVDAFDPVYGLLCLIGICTWGRVFGSRSQQAVFYMNLALMTAVWLYLARHHLVDGRYFFPTVITAAPFAALGLMTLVGQLSRLSRRLPWKAQSGWITAALLAAMAVLGYADALSTDLTGRRQQAELGRWILREFGPGREVMGNKGSLVVAFYAHAAYVPMPENADYPSVRHRVADHQPDLVLLWQQPFHTAEWMSVLTSRLQRLGLKPLPQTELQMAERVTVFARNDETQNIH